MREGETLVVMTTVIMPAGDLDREETTAANHALDQADSEYVMFLPPGRAPLPGALDRLHAVGAGRDADVVVGRAGGSGPLVPRVVDSCYPTVLLDDRSLDRLVRTRFLRDRGIGFRALGDLSSTAFLVELFLASPEVAADLDQITSSWHGEAGDATRGLPASPTAYGSGLRQILDMIETHTEPGPRRDSFAAALWQHEVVSRLGRRDLVTLPSAQAWNLLQEARSACADRVPIALDERLGPALSPLAGLVRSGVPEEISELAARIEQVQPLAWVTTLASTAGAAVDIGVQVGLQQRDRPLSLRAGAAGWLLPTVLAGEDRGADAGAAAFPAELPAEVLLRHRRLGTEVVLPADLNASVEQVGDDGEIIWSGAARFEADPGRGRFILTEGRYDLLVRTKVWGLDRETTVSAAGLDVPDQVPILIGPDDRINRFRTTRQGHLGVEVGARPSAVLSRLAASQVVAERQGIGVDLGVLWTSSSVAASLSLTPVAGGARTSIRLTAGPRPGQWTATPRRSWISLRQGRYSASLTVELPGAGGRQSGRRTVRLVPPVTIPRSIAAWWLVRLVARRARTRSRAWFRRMGPRRASAG